MRRLAHVMACASVCGVARVDAQRVDARDAFGASIARVSAMTLVTLTGANGRPGGGTRSEGYLTQPNLFIDARWRAVQLWGTLNAERWTLAHGELTMGAYGEGFVDRRHPHTTVHEVMAAVSTSRTQRVAASLSVGKGFVPFGSDDPMMRPLAKYPANHHHAQLLERAMLIGAAAFQVHRRVRVALEQAWFNGDEPISPQSVPRRDRVGDSHATRVTTEVGSRWELAGSRAFVRSPGLVQGGAFDHRQSHLSLRYAANAHGGPDTHGHGGSLLLAEVARTDEYSGTRRAFRFRSALIEGSRPVASWRLAMRGEWTERPEQVRLANLDRVSIGHVDAQIVGITAWSIGTLEVSAPPVRGTWHSSLAPFVALTVGGARAQRRPAAFDPPAYYGTRSHVQLSLGARIGAGSMRQRMGRYGVLAAPVAP
jgi:hypothetical protein